MNLLDMEFQSELGKITLRKYFLRCMKEFWNDGEGFSGKRPFGNSGWQWDIYRGMIVNKWIEGTLDENGYIKEMSDENKKEAHRMIYNALENWTKEYESIS